jgi:PP-loop superfamily ATP-utilizing enzyme
LSETDSKQITGILLKEIILEMKLGIVAYSRGVDSPLLLKLAYNEMGKMQT